MQIGIMYDNYYFIGIGGIGMSALARYFKHIGKNVSGYDRTPSHLTAELESEGIQIHYEDRPDLVPINVAKTFVIYTPAIPADLGEMQYVQEKGYSMCKRSRALGEIAGDKDCLAISGTHGKTTTSTLLAHIFASGTEDGCTAFLGGISKNYHNNLLLSRGNVLVAEADEFDRSFLQLHPKIAVVTSIDADHLDIYGTREQLIDAFRQFASQARTVVVEESIEHLITHPHKIVYGMGDRADYRAGNLRTAPNNITFDLHTPAGEISNLTLHANGRYNVLNATAAIAAITEETQTGIRLSREHIMEKIRTFAGVKRRFDYILDREDLVYIDDYAHHPEEMRSFITAVRNAYPGKRICGVFQPHLYSRTRDFAPQFAEVLALLDDIILLPIYPARETPLPGITSEWLLSLIGHPSKRVLAKEELLPYLRAHRPDVLLTIGAGDIDRLVKPLGEGL